METQVLLIENKILILKNTLSNFKKSPNRKCLKQTLLNKLKLVKETYNDIINSLVLIETELSITQLTYYTKLARTLYNDINLIITQKLTYSPERRGKFKSIVNAAIFCNRTKKIYNAKMASVIEIIKVITSLVPSYDGNPQKINNIISSLQACKPLITNDNKNAALQTILSRMEGKARAAITDNPESIDIIITKLKEKCQLSVEPNTLIAKLNATKQSGGFVRFSEEVEKLTLQLERAYLSENVPIETATKLATNAGLKALSTGAKNNDVKQLFKFREFNSLTKAIEKASEIESEKLPSDTEKVFTYKQNSNRKPLENQPQHRYQNSRYGNQNFHNRNRGYQNPQYNNRNPHFHDRNNQQNNWRQNSFNNQQMNFRLPRNQNFNPNYRPPNDQHYNPNLYYVTPENQLVPQQVPVGGQNIIQDQQIIPGQQQMEQLHQQFQPAIHQQ